MDEERDRAARRSWKDPPLRAARNAPGGSRALELLASICILGWAIGAGLTPRTGMAAGIGATAIGLGVVSLFFAPSALLPLLRPSGRDIGWGVAAGLVMLVVTYGAYPRLSAASPALAAQVKALYAILAAGPQWATAALLPFIIIAEELIWRGVVFAALRRRMPLAATVLLGTALYAAGHAPVGSGLLVVLCLACGLYWSALRAWSGSLVPVLISHLVWDLFVFLLRPLA
jgi:membrane protease YdiL (CAAX protease family)